MKNMCVYILLRSDETYYTGVTNNLEVRFLQHQEGINKDCYTYSRRPLLSKKVFKRGTTSSSRTDSPPASSNHSN
ncbi:MAG: GIY-YIG nuclease family protein [Bacteroidia bacterium]